MFSVNCKEELCYRLSYYVIQPMHIKRTLFCPGEMNDIVSSPQVSQLKHNRISEPAASVKGAQCR